MRRGWKIVCKKNIIPENQREKKKRKKCVFPNQISVSMQNDDLRWVYIPYELKAAAAIELWNF